VKGPSKVAVKFRNAATGETWTGRGLKPKWLKAQLDAGKKIRLRGLGAGGSPLAGEGRRGRPLLLFPFLPLLLALARPAAPRACLPGLDSSRERTRPDSGHLHPGGAGTHRHRRCRRRHVTLKKGGANLLGLCPFHGEKSPSFTVSPAKQFYHCFGCGAHGDAIRFLMEHAGMGFSMPCATWPSRQACRCPRRGWSPPSRPRVEEERARQASLTGVLEKAAAHYRERLRQSPRAIDYLKRRGLDGQTARAFGLGYAPEGWRALASAFPSYDDPALGEAGLVITQGEEGPEQKRYDRFRDRIMFPIRSVKGAGHRLRRARAGHGRAEVPEFAGDAGLRQGTRALRPVRGPRSHARARLRPRRGGLHGRGGAGAVGHRQRGGHARHGLHRRPRAASSCVSPTTSSSASTATRQAGAAAGRALEAALPHVNDLRTFRFLFLPPEHDPDSFVRERGARGLRRRRRRPPRRCRGNSSRTLPRAATWRRPRAGRACCRRPARCGASMPQGALRAQILAELAAAARMDVQAVSRLWGLAGEARPPRQQADFGWHRRWAPPARPG
jgi:DNA primase